MQTESRQIQWMPTNSVLGHPDHLEWTLSCIVRLVTVQLEQVRTLPFLGELELEQPLPLLAAFAEEVQLLPFEQARSVHDPLDLQDPEDALAAEIHQVVVEALPFSSDTYLSFEA